jgi:transcriptional regulator with XRE-family HTH domain
MSASTNNAFDFLKSSKRKLLSKEELSSTVAKRLKKARELSGYGGMGGAVELCKELGYKAPNMISKFEAGGRVPMNVLVELARAYGVSADYLLGLTDSPDGDAVHSLRLACVSKLNGTVAKVLEQLVIGDYQILKDVPPISSFASDLVEAVRSVDHAITRFKQLNPSFEDLRGGSNLVNSIETAGVACVRLDKAIKRYQTAVDYRFSHAIERTQKSTGQFDLFASINN